ncbi:hypothetical protein BDD12DRAFT_805015 [Trichophaea hybrida]|nr:hypothetical protein BDD12DRAFT_805015 [Trichophaea hybrida]
MPTPVHDCFGEFICTRAGDIRATEFLTKEKSRTVIVWCGSTDYASPSSATGTPGGKAVGIVKQPNVALQWLIRSARRVMRMFLVKIEEDDCVRRSEGVEDDDASGSMAEEVRAKSMLLGSDDSTPDEYDELFEDITVEDWIGKLTVFIEEYRYDSDSRVVVMHGVEDSEALDYIASPLTLHIEDIFPDVKDGRRFELPLQEFCEHLEMSRRELAVIRYYDGGRMKRVWWMIGGRIQIMCQAISQRLKQAEAGHVVLCFWFFLKLGFHKCTRKSLIIATQEFQLSSSAFCLYIHFLCNAGDPTFFALLPASIDSNEKQFKAWCCSPSIWIFG